jgi:hypothetical protein
MARWRPRIPGGTLVEIAGARKPGWLAEDRDNPLRGWDGRWNISRARFAKATAQYRATRRAVMAEASAGDGELAASRLAQIGRQYAGAFNRLGSRPRSSRHRNAKNCSTRSTSSSMTPKPQPGRTSRQPGTA